MAGGHRADHGDRGRLGHPAAGQAGLLGRLLGPILSEHGWTIAAPALVALASVFAAIHWAARKVGLGDLGRKVEHIDRGLREDSAAHDRDLAAALRRDRAAEWGPGDSEL